MFVLEILVVILIFLLFVRLFFLSWKKFRLLFSVNISILILFAAIGGISGYKPCFSAFFVILFPFGAFYVVFNFVVFFKFWEERGFLALSPLFISLFSFWLIFFANDIGRDIRIQVFKKNLYLYQQAVEELTPAIGEKGLYLSGDKIPEKYRKLAYVISAEKNEGVVFDFIWDFGFPLKHSAFVYRSDGFLPGKETHFRSHWPYCERINERWFRVMD